MRSPSPGPPDGHERGQATVELALLLPLLLLLVLAAVQVGLVVRDQVLLVHATREAARSAAVGASGGAPAPSPGGLDPARLELTAASDGRVVRAVGRYRTPVVVPLLSALRREVVLQSALTMWAEDEP